MQKVLDEMIARALAKEIEFSSSMARQYGFDFPVEYDVGISTNLIRSGRDWYLETSVRLNDITHQVKLPVMNDARGTLVTSIRKAAAVLTNEYINKHPEINPSIDAAKKVITLMGELDKTAFDVVSDNANAICENAVYTKRN